MKNLILSIVFIVTIVTKTQAQALYAPITTTNYNIDGVAETSPSSLTTSSAIDGSNFVMHSMAYAALYSMSVGLPNSGLISSTTKTFQLQPYNQNNILYLLVSQVDSLVIVTPAPYNAISIIGMATEGVGTMNVTLRFTDNSTQVFNNISLPDWFTGTANILNGFGRTSRTTGVISTPASAPNLYTSDYNLTCTNRIKNLKSIKFNNVSTNGRICIMGASGASNAMVITNTFNPVTCQGGTNGSATVVTTGGTPPFTYTWSSTPAQFGNVLNNVPIGVYTYSLLDAGSCLTTNTIAVSASITTQPSIFVSSNGTAVCLGNTVAIAASGVNTYSWSNGSNSQLQIVTPSVNTVYNIIGYSAANCLLSGSISISVFPVPTVAISSVPPQLCINSNSFTIITTPNGGTLTGNNLVLAGFSPSLAGIGTYTFNYIFTSTDNCSASSNATTVVNALPGVSLNLNPPPLCNTSPNLNLTNFAQPTGGVFSGTGVSNSIFSPSVAGAGNFVIQYIYTDANNCSSSATSAIGVNTLAAPGFSIAKSFFCANSSNIFVTSSPSNGTYSGSGLSAAGLFNPATAGVGSHILSYSISSGPCSSYSNLTVTVSTCAGITENTLLKVALWPNPNAGLFNIEMERTGNLILYNNLGDVILRQDLNEGLNQINKHEIAYGLYFAVIHSGDQIIKKEIVIREQ
jgi:hypothetical protein